MQMKKNKHVYIDIQGIVLDKNTYYAVTKKTIYDIVLFGSIIKKVEKIEELPFIFKSITVAKDFCELNPTFKLTTCCANKRVVKYVTYDITINDKVHAYIIWDTNSESVEFYYSSLNNDKVLRPRSVYPIIDGFVKDEKCICTSGYWSGNNVSTSIYNIVNKVEKLSDIFKIDKNNKYQFELVEK